MRNNQVTPDVSCWTSVMQGYFHSDRYNDGIHVLERMIEDNVKPNLHTLSVLVAGSSEAGNLKLAEKVLDQGLSRIQPKIKDNSHALADVNKRALSTELYSSDLPLTIDDLLNRKAQHSIQIPPPHLFTPLIDAYANSDNFIKAKALVRDMLQLGVSFNETAYVSIMTLYQKQGAYDVVEKLWQHLHQRSADTLDMSSMDPDMQISLPLPDIEYKTTELLHMHGDSTNRFVQLLASAPPTPSASPFALSIYIDSLSSQQRIDDIQQLWSELTQQSYSFDEQNWNRYIVALAEAGLGDQACSVAVDYLEHQAPRRIQRPWDDFEASEKSNHLHARTIQALASALDLVVEGYSTYQLQAAVYDHLNIDTTSLEKD